MDMKYLFTGRDKNGNRINAVATHPSCFGMIGYAKNHGHPLVFASLDPVIYLSTEESRKDFNRWYSRFTKEFPSITVNGKQVKAPKAVYYDKGSKRVGNRSDYFPHPGHVRITFPKSIGVSECYNALKFYFKALCMPLAYDSGLSTKTWDRIEKGLIEEGIEKPTMAMILWASPFESTRNTRSYRYPTPTGLFSKKEFKEFIWDNVFVGGSESDTECKAFDPSVNFNIHSVRNGPLYGQHGGQASVPLEELFRANSWAEGGHANGIKRAAEIIKELKEA